MDKYSNITDEIRCKAVDKLNSVVDNIYITRNIEKSIYNYVILTAKERNIQRRWLNPLFKKLYFSKVISIYLNLNNETYIKNEKLLSRILTKEIKPEEVGKLSVYDIFPDNWKDLLNAKSKRDKIKYELKPEAMTDQYKCRKCGSRKCSYYEMQTRSADEPMTQFFTCIDCDNRWKM